MNDKAKILHAEWQSA